MAPRLSLAGPVGRRLRQAPDAQLAILGTLGRDAAAERVRTELAAL
ncbi:hypothetical protein [Kitasatospora camelliae]|uniref:Uncharacterized protein n=1 Tax=Kitasatospora camelliae TaxID=3156397 RepID=A0AAU8K5Z0_9ACTN